MQDELTEAEYRRVTRLPEQIDRAIAKVDRLLARAAQFGFQPSEWAAQWDELRSRFLTDPKLIDREWEREVSRARNSNGENE